MTWALYAWETWALYAWVTWALNNLLLNLILGDLMYCNNLTHAFQAESMSGLLLNRSIVKSDNKIGIVNDKKNLI